MGVLTALSSRSFSFKMDFVENVPKLFITHNGRYHGREIYPALSKKESTWCYERGLTRKYAPQNGKTFIHVFAGPSSSLYSDSGRLSSWYYNQNMENIVWLSVFREEGVWYLCVEHPNIVTPGQSAMYALRPLPGTYYTSYTIAPARRHALRAYAVRQPVGWSLSYGEKRDLEIDSKIRRRSVAQYKSRRARADHQRLIFLRDQEDREMVELLDDVEYAEMAMQMEKTPVKPSTSSAEVGGVVHTSEDDPFKRNLIFSFEKSGKYTHVGKNMFGSNEGQAFVKNAEALAQLMSRNRAEKRSIGVANLRKRGIGSVYHGELDLEVESSEQPIKKGRCKPFQSCLYCFLRCVFECV